MDGMDLCFARISGQRPECDFALCECEGFQGARLIVLAQHHHAKLTVVGQQHLPIGAEIFLYLLRLDRLACVFRESLHFNHAAIRRLYGEVFRQGVFLELILGEESAVRQSGSPVPELENRLDTRFQSIADFREQPLNRRIERRFIGCMTGRANFRQLGEIGLYRMHMTFLERKFGFCIAQNAAQRVRICAKVVYSNILLCPRTQWVCAWMRGDMDRHYSTRDFFRQMPNALLARYFAARSVLAEMDFAALQETKPEPLFAAWLELPEGQGNAMDAELREIHALSCEKGWCAIRDEAQWQYREEPEALTAFVERMGSMDGHFERAMIAFLEHPQLWKGATLFCHADNLSHWRKRKGFPHQPASVHEDGREALAASIRDYFHRTEGRSGKRQPWSR
jgi:hypothetical protein